MPSNVQTNLQMTINAVDTTAAASVFTRIISGFQLGATSWQAADWLQVPTAGVTLALPAAIVYFVYIRNLGTNNVIVSFTPMSEPSTSIALLPVGSNVGGVFLYALSAESGGGITSITLTAQVATTPTEYFVAA